tara:strand:+ start:1835 stop:2014 length:180 start_codon:yes stop_codon:yes gene_type:complete
MLFENFFSMGGYGIYVWSAYAITFIVLILNLFFTIKKEKKILRNYKKINNHNNKENDVT